MPKAPRRQGSLMAEDAGNQANYQSRPGTIGGARVDSIRMR